MQAVRVGKWKLFKADREQFYGYVDDRGSQEVELYDLENDLGESTNVASQHPEVVSELLDYLRDFPMPETPYYTGIALPEQPDGES